MLIHYSVSFVSAMRFSLILLLFTILGALACKDEEEDLITGIVMPIKNGHIQLIITDHNVVLDLRKNGNKNYNT